MTNDSGLFDERRFPETWRFNSPDCRLTDADKRRLIFLDPAPSRLLWNDQVSPAHSHLMEMPGLLVGVLERTVLDFADEPLGTRFFLRHLDGPGITPVTIFWGPACACLVPPDILARAWTDFFYPSDENAIVSLPGSRRKIFSFEETFFVATLPEPRA